MKNIAFLLIIISGNIYAAAAPFNTVKTQIDTAFKAFFDNPEIKNFVITVRRDADLDSKIKKFNDALPEVLLFVKENNKGLLGKSSDNLANASTVIANEGPRLVASLMRAKNYVVAKDTLEQESARIVYYELEHMLGRLNEAINKLAPLEKNYSSTGQKESFALLMLALNKLKEATVISINRIRNHAGY